jgi:MFS family permease
VFDGIGFLRGLAPWRIAFILVGSFGFVLTALFVMLREPPRQDVGAARSAGLRVGDSLRYFSTYHRLFVPLYGALAMFAFGASAATGWGAVLLTRVFGLKPGSAGQLLGTGQILWALAGALVASVLVDRVARRAGATGKMYLTGALAIPACLGGVAGSGTVAAIMLAEVTFASAIYGTSMLSVITEITPIRSRGVAVALYAFVMSIIGASLGPLAVAFLTERVFAAPTMVGASMAIVGTAGLVVSALLSVLAVRRLHDEGARDGMLADLLQVSAASRAEHA